MNLESIITIHRQWNVFHSIIHTKTNRLAQNGVQADWKACHFVPYANVIKHRETIFNEEPDLDNWKGSGINVDSNNSQMYLVPNGFINYCDSYKNIQSFVSRTPSRSLCHCQHAHGSWRKSKMCCVSSSALSIARYIA